MAITSNLKGTSYPSFTIGKQGVAVLQGTVDPLVGQGVNGDLYLQAGATPALWQKVAGAWNKIGNFGSKIFTGTTSVDTAEVADTITVNIAAKRIIDILNDAASINGERLTIKNGNAGITLSTSDTSTTNAVDFVVDVQGTGAFKVQSDAESAIRTSDGSTITIQPGDKTDGAGGNVIIQGGATSAPGQNGGNIYLTPGQNGQVLAPSNYTANTPDSFVTLKDVGSGGGSAAKWYSGTTTPNNANGIDGDFYLNSVDGKFYEKVSGAWVERGNLTGPTGSPGTPGTNGQDGVDGAPGADGTAGAKGESGVPNEVTTLNEAKISAIESAAIDWIIVASTDARLNKTLPAGISGDKSGIMLQYIASTNTWTTVGRWQGLPGSTMPSYEVVIAHSSGIAFGGYPVTEYVGVAANITKVAARTAALSNNTCEFNLMVNGNFVQSFTATDTLQVWDTDIPLAVGDRIQFDVFGGDATLLSTTLAKGN